MTKCNTSVLWIATGVGAILGLLFVHISNWIPAGFSLVGFVIGHIIVASSTHYPLPQVAVLLASVYYLFAPLIAIYYPPRVSLFSLQGNLATYFDFAVPCLFSLAIGWSYAFNNLKMLPIAHRAQGIDQTATKELDALLYFGLAVTFMTSFVQPPLSLRFIVMLLGNLRYLGVFGWMLLALPGWKPRLCLVVAVELYMASRSGGFFLDFALLCVNIGVILIARYRPPQALITFSIIAGLWFLPAVQYAKWQYRHSTWGVQVDQQFMDVFGTLIQINKFNGPALILAKTVEGSWKLITLNELDEFLGEIIIRYNQGWIVERIMNHVPKYQPFAEGETIWATVIASIFPRIILPNKMMSGGAELFTRFTGVRLTGNTSMNLGFVGEMYANFGYYGGILGCGFYGLFLGSILNKLLRASQTNLLRLSFVPFILNFAVVSEAGLLEVLNYTIKAMIFAYVIYLFFPHLFAPIDSRSMHSTRTLT